MNLHEVNFHRMLVAIGRHCNINLAVSNVIITGKGRPAIVCENLAYQCGIFQSAINEANIDFFNFSMNEDSFWGTIYLSYESHNGGSNGMKICTVWYKDMPDETEWTIEFEQSKELLTMHKPKATGDTIYPVADKQGSIKLQSESDTPII